MLGFVTGINCIDILATSDAISTMIGAHVNYLSAKVTLKNNCCGTEYTNTTLNLDPTDNEISSNPIPIVTGLTFTKINIENTATGEVFSIPMSLVITDCTSVIAVTDAINTYMDSNYPGESFIAGCDITSGNLTYTLTSSSGNFIAYSVNYVVGISSVINTISFIQPIIYITPSGIVINPSIITSDLTSFSDGVYSICVTLTVKPGPGAGIIQQCGCVFVNCITTCKTLNTAQIASDKDAIAMLMYLYGLEHAGDCMCDCTYMCKLFLQLTELLNSYSVGSNILTNDCGCS